MELTAEVFAFYCCIMVVFVDLMGQHFTMAVLVPYTMDVGATVEEVSYFVSANMACRIVGNFFMPWLSDKTSRKLTMIISTFGSFVAYTVSGMAQYVSAENRGDFYTLLAGRILGGLFGGTMSLAIAYITELTMYDMDKLKLRITVVMATFSVAPIAMSPIGGAVATFGLNLPFLISGAVALLGFLFALKYMKDVADVRKADGFGGSSEEEAAAAEGEGEGETAGAEMERGDSVLDGAEAAEEKSDEGDELAHIRMSQRDGALAEEEQEDGTARLSRPKDRVQGSAWCDSTIWLMGLGYGCLGMAMVMIMMYLPLMLEEDKFGLAGTFGSLDRKEDVAKTVGLVAIPQGLVGFIFQTVVYMQLSSRGWSDKVCMLLGGVVMTGSALGLSFVDSLGLVFVAMGGVGLGQGLFMGAYSNLPTSYIAKFYPHNIAEARSVPVNFLYGGLAAGPLIAGQVYTNEGQKLSWITVSAAFGMCTAILCFAATRIEANLLDPDQVVAEEIQHRVLLETHAPVSYTHLTLPTKRIV
eukprot:TRINITY_DN6370_c0_g1_i2.p1 TRINITY_DN6370_c0_g1~~TRINITY_DN6370_c0_g1_i2.p1  ORF type:complete len:527 (-),score=149.19 TRINITY_DN6370_c0_g1_i2:165-1745(-)